MHSFIYNPLRLKLPAGIVNENMGFKASVELLNRFRTKVQKVGPF
jgi:hypothetical protein